MGLVGDAESASVTFSADPRNVGQARAVLRELMERSGAEHLVDAATVLLSEVVTNAFVHVGGVTRLDAWATGDAVRVEVEDGSSDMPARRHYATTAGTGRGLQLMDELADRWGAHERSVGKVVWFEIGAATGFDDARRSPGSAASGTTTGSEPVRLVTLRHVPILMHVAWQEHAATLLREYLLHVMGEDDDIMEKHAHASAAMNLLHEQLPAPALSDEPRALMADAIEPHVTAHEVVLRVPVPAVEHFQTLDALLGNAVGHARAGLFLSPPTQPEIDEMRQWMCSEIARQAGGQTTATPWVARTDVRATLADQAALEATYAGLAVVDEPLLATDEASIIVAASQPALELLGYSSTEELLGRRVIVVVPERFHQAHIAGTTLHATNGRNNLLGVPIDVPMVRADGTEVLVHIEVRAQRLDDDLQVFVARFRAAERVNAT